MIFEDTRYQLINKSADELISAYRSAASSLGAAPECLGYEVSRGVDQPGCVIVRTMWTSAKDHRDGFRNGPHFPRFFSHVRPFVCDLSEMRHYAPTDVMWSR